jgi:hypothetical protein
MQREVDPMHTDFPSTGDWKCGYCGNANRARYGQTERCNRNYCMAPRYLEKADAGRGGGKLSVTASKILQMQLTGSEDAAEEAAAARAAKKRKNERGGDGGGGEGGGGGDEVADAWSAAIAAASNDVKNSGAAVEEALAKKQSGEGKRPSLYAAQGGNMDMEGNRPKKMHKKGRKPGDPAGPSYVRDKW